MPNRHENSDTKTSFRRKQKVKVKLKKKRRMALLLSSIFLFSSLRTTSLTISERFTEEEEQQQEEKAYRVVPDLSYPMYKSQRRIQSIYWRWVLNSILRSPTPSKRDKISRRETTPRGVVGLPPPIQFKLRDSIYLSSALLRRQTLVPTWKFRSLSR